ncbi:MAG: DUF547 domain-containing protein [Planctomycetota bacterium]|nr:DUF547 domain-containing protein [Planctomycetota bacterium]
MKLTHLLSIVPLMLSACSASPGALTSTATAPAGEFDHGHELLDGLLARHVRPNGVDYDGLANESEALDRYLAGLHAVGPDQLEGWSREQRYAFWINTYNAHILRLIVDARRAGEVQSIRDLGGNLINRIWDQELIPIQALNPNGASRLLTFSEVEHEILRPRFQDARVHAAINCASVSCPPLLPEAFEAGRLEQQLDQAMAAFLADSTRNQLDQGAGELRLSLIFDWFAEDFERDAGGVPEYVQRYAGGAEQDWILSARVKHLPYDWSLNNASE